jgi:putative modified peptide
MADSKLSREHSLALLHKLATDDGFRNRYEQSPAAALAEIGVPSDVITSFMSSCETSGPLASKDRFAEARRRLLDADADACVQMYVPDPRLNFENK